MLPSSSFFKFEQKEYFKIGEFESQDPDAPQPIYPSEHCNWRRRYIAKYADESLHETTPILPRYVTIWLHEQVRIVKEAKQKNQDDIIPTQMARIVAVTNISKHNLFLMSSLPDESILKEDKYNDSYIFIKAQQPGIFHIINGKHSQLQIKFTKVFNDLVNFVKLKKDTEPFQNLIDENRLKFFWSLIKSNEGHTHLKVTCIAIPTIVMPSVFEKPQGLASAAYNDQLVGNGFFSDSQNKHNALYDFFITHANERKPFLQINQILKSPTLNFLLRQVDGNVEVLDLYSLRNSCLQEGPQGAYHNFTYLVNTLKAMMPASKNEIEAATVAMQQSKDSAHVLAFREYIKLAKLAQEEFIKKVKTILSYWSDKVKDIYPLPAHPPYKRITDFNTFLKDALTALDDKPMLDFFYNRVYGAIVFKENEEPRNHRRYY